MHPDADAILHPDCAGCAALVARAAELDHLTNATRRTAAWSAVARPIEDVLAAQRQMRRDVEQWQTVPDPRPRPGRLAGHRAERLIIDDPPPPTPLLDRDPSHADLAAERDEPRPGVWAGEDGTDLRALTQDETDMLIRAELWHNVPPGEQLELKGAIGELRRVFVSIGERMEMPIYTQRGGIDSEPMVRILARRAWGDRDRRWFELRGLRAGEEVAAVRTSFRWRQSTDWLCALARPGERWPIGAALADARPGQLVEVRELVGTPDARVRKYRVSDRLRAEPEPSLAVRLAQRELARLNDLELDAEVDADGVLIGRDPERAVRSIAAASGRPVAEVRAEMHELLARVADADEMGRHAMTAENLARAFGVSVGHEPVDAAPARPAGGTRRTPPERPKPPVPRWARERRR